MPKAARTLHPWRLSYAEAVDVQNRLRGRVRLTPLPVRSVRHVAGADIAIDKRAGRLFVAVVVMSFPELELLETRTVSAPLDFPYIPGLLSFREVPGLVKCIERVRTPFDVLLCDGQGIAHPRGLGLASHLGLVFDTPTIGCAKSRLCGEHDEPGPERGDFSRLTHEGQYVGSVLRTRERVKPIFVSPGHRVDHPSARRIVLRCLTRYRLPEPTRLADIAAGQAKRDGNSATSS